MVILFFQDGQQKHCPPCCPDEIKSSKNQHGDTDTADIYIYIIEEVPPERQGEQKEDGQAPFFRYACPSSF